MSHFKVTNKMIFVILATLVVISLLSGCTPTLTILDGSTHACGNVHVEGYFTDTQGDVVVAKAPPDWTPEQVKEFCSGQ